MRAMGCFLLGVVAAVLVVAFGVFALENGQMTQFSFLGNTMRVNLWLLVGIPAVLGFLLALLMVTPARAATDRHGSTVRGQYRLLETDLANQQRQNAELRTENSRLQARYDQMVAERSRLNAQLAAAQQAAAPPVGDSVATPVRDTAATPARDSAVYTDTPLTTRREEPIAPTASTGDDRVQEQAAATDEAVAQREPVQPAPTAPPTLGERLRGVLGGPRTTEEEEADRLNSRGPAPTM